MITADNFVALYGGSFNPSTNAHRDVGLFVLNEIKADEVWYLVSPQNPFKTRTGMASFADRVTMTRLNLEGHSGLVVQDIEAKYAAAKPNGVIESAETLRHLTKDFPNHRFAWVMGADNLTSFHRWGDYDYIAKNFPIIVVPRPGFTEAALKSQSALSIPRIEDPSELRRSNGWYLSQMPPVDVAATASRSELERGEQPSCLRPSVASYALARGIYSPSPTPASGG